MGTNASPEQFQYIIQQALAGVQNMADDIILFASNRLEHDERLKALLLRLKQVGLTLNASNCVNLELAQRSSLALLSQVAEFQLTQRKLNQ